MTIVRCTKSPAVNPYVVLATGNVKGCPLHHEVAMDTCKACSSHSRLE